MTGTGDTVTFTNIDIAVTSGPFGENPTGHVSFDSPIGLIDTNSISCLAVSGRATTIGIALPPGAPFAALVLTAVDNGPAGSSLDQFGLHSIPPAPPTTCPTPLPIGEPVTSGDIVVIDAARRRGLGCGDPKHTHIEAAACGTSRETAGLKQDSVVGSGDFGSFFMDLDLNVTSGPQGQSPTGHISGIALGVAVESSSITCLSVAGKVATIGGALEPNSGGFTAFVANVADFGPTGSGQDLFFALPQEAAPTTCPPPTPILNPGTGDIVVRDAGHKRGLGCGDPNHTHGAGTECGPRSGT